MDEALKRNIAKIGLFSSLAWISYKIVQGLTSNKSTSQIVKETVAPVEKVASEIKKTTKRLLKGSPEAKEYMAKIRSKNKTKRGEGKRAMRKKKLRFMGESEYEPTKEQKSMVKDAQALMDKAEAGKKGGEATADLGKHKGHKTKRGLSQDQKLVSKEMHEKHFQKSKARKVKI